MVIEERASFFLQSRDKHDVTFTDTATDDFKKPSRVRTVIAADFDNDGNEDIFFNNIPGTIVCSQKSTDRQSESNQYWTGVRAHDAWDRRRSDMDGDGILELIVSHGECV